MTGWHFTIVIQGEGADMQEAWEDAVLSFSLDPGDPEDCHPEQDLECSDFEDCHP